MCTGGVEGDVCIPMGVLKGMCEYQSVCAGVAEGDMCIPMYVRWGC